MNQSVRADNRNVLFPHASCIILSPFLYYVIHCCSWNTWICARIIHSRYNNNIFVLRYWFQFIQKSWNYRLDRCSKGKNQSSMTKWFFVFLIVPFFSSQVYTVVAGQKCAQIFNPTVSVCIREIREYVCELIAEKSYRRHIFFKPFEFD